MGARPPPPPPLGATPGAGAGAGAAPAPLLPLLLLDAADAPAAKEDPAPPRESASPLEAAALLPGAPPASPPLPLSDSAERRVREEAPVAGKGGVPVPAVAEGKSFTNWASSRAFSKDPTPGLRRDLVEVGRGGARGGGACGKAPAPLLWEEAVETLAVEEALGAAEVVGGGTGGGGTATGGGRVALGAGGGTADDSWGEASPSPQFTDSGSAAGILSGGLSILS
jgi:hypothetical protein